MVVVGAVGILSFEEGELGLVLLPRHQDGLELRAIDCNVLCSSLQQL